ncbi:MAG: hypothetical protein FJ301_08215 [Planctomycetes bacterium]|nr:hypothetical protein [Planctomycetota bacterium]
MRRRPAALLPQLLLAAAATAQAPAAGKDAGATAKADPVAMVAQAEKQLGKKDADVEAAVMLLWQALDELAAAPASTVRDATALSARFLLQQHDPREGERRKAHASIAKQQLDLATAYRLKKWLDTATTRVDAAERFERDAGSKERAAIAAARPKDKPATGKPASAPAKPASAAPSLLQKAQAEFAVGSWTEIDGGVRLAPLTPDASTINEWVSRATHADHEVALEFRPLEAGRKFDVALCVGLGILPDSNVYSGVRLHLAYDPEGDQIGVQTIQLVRGAHAALADVWHPATKTADGWRRLAVRVQGESLRVFVDETDYGASTAKGDVRGKIGMMNGMSGRTTCGLEIRNLRIAPLPADAPTDAELKAKAAADDRDAITRLVDEGKALADKKQPEAAAAKLREALTRIDAMDAGVLRDALRSGVEPQLDKADPLSPRRRKTAQAIATELIALADQYATAGWARAAEQVVAQAAAFDPVGTSPRADAARTAVQQWNLAQATARAAELQPPSDDGAVLREWFAKGRKLDTSAGGFAIDGAAARVDVLEPDALAAWLPHPLAPKAQQAALSVRLAANETSAGLVVDAVDQTNYTIAVVTRRKAGLQLAVYRFAGRAWTTLARRDVPLDAWRLDGWHRLSVTSNAVGITARMGDAEVKVARAVCGRATGLIGLFASNSGAQPVACEVRAFEVGT